MRKVIVCTYYLLILLVASCAEPPGEPTKSKTPTRADSVQKIIARRDSGYRDLIAQSDRVLKEKTLSACGNSCNEFRIYRFAPLFYGGLEFYKADLRNYTLRFTTFYMRSSSPFKDTLLSDTIIPLKPGDVKELEKLIRNSMFWSLQSVNPEEKLCLDAELLIYEMDQKVDRRGLHDDYHYVARYCEGNNGFNEVKHFLLKKTSRYKYYLNMADDRRGRQ